MTASVLSGVDLAGRSIFVTGAGGFIGRWVVAALVQAGGRVRALVGPPGTPALDNAAVACRTAEIDDFDAIAAEMHGADLVVHLAGPPSVAASFEQPEEYARCHVLGTAAVLKAIRPSVSRLVYLSSAEVYGQPDQNPVTEVARVAPRSPYGAAKLAAEAFIGADVHARGLQAVILRAFSVYGPGQPRRSLAATVLTQALHGSTVQLADLRPVRDYVYVADLAEAVALACVAPARDQEAIYNIGSGSGISVGDLACRALSVLGRRADVIGRATADRPPGADILALIADPSRAAQRLGWRSRTPLDAGLAQTAAWLRGQGPAS